MEPGGIREVWGSDVEEEFILISELAESYPFVSLDAQFPGLLAKARFSSDERERYHTQTFNMNLIKIVQIGLTLGNGDGQLATPYCTWQFNFKFNLAEDLHTPEAIASLQQAQYDFSKSERDGIDPADFAHLLLASGLVMNENVVWICFQGEFGFAHLLRMLSGRPLPSRESDFVVLFKQFFPHFYDVKVIMFVEEQTMCGLAEMAKTLRVKRYGIEKQAGSESLVALMVFYRSMMTHFHGEMRQEKFRNTLYGTSGPLF
jgi:CCR4-NOT transcription complex subunit 7/8